MPTSSCQQAKIFLSASSLLYTTPIMSKKSEKKIKKLFEKIQFFTFVKLLTLDPNGAHTWDRKTFPIPQALSATYTYYLYYNKNFKLCTILLCSTQHTFWSTKSKNHILTFDQHKTSNKGYHSNQSPILKFSPSNCLHFLFIHPSAEFNHFWGKKPFIQPYPNFTMSAILVSWL